jgi:GNAT superfamily N-acetyltransferase
MIAELIRELAEYERSADRVEATPGLLEAALFGPSPAVFAHVAEADGAVAGFALWYVSFSTWLARHGLYLEDLYVRPAYRGRGLGRALLAELARLAAGRGYGRLEWWVLDWNSSAIGFYRSLGAEPMDEWTVWRVDGERLGRLAR